MDNVQFDHCVIHVSDWDRSNLFYRDVVGAEMVDHPDGLWAYRFGEQQLNVHGPGVSLVRSAESSLDSLRKLYEPRRDRIEID